jgi:hypothetical protein
MICIPLLYSAPFLFTSNVYGLDEGPLVLAPCTSAEGCPLKSAVPFDTRAVSTLSLSGPFWRTGFDSGADFMLVDGGVSSGGVGIISGAFIDAGSVFKAAPCSAG